MHVPFRSFLLGAAAVVALSAGAARAGIVSHNGTVDSTPGGSDDVNVALACTPTAAAVGDICTKNFGELATHVMNVGYTGPANLQETVFNNTGTPWTDYHFTIAGGGTFTDTGNLTLPDGVSASIDFSGTAIDLLFTGGTIGNGQSFGISLFLSGANGGEFSAAISQAPSVEAPEPASLALFGAGLGGLALLRRRRAAGWRRG